MADEYTGLLGSLTPEDRHLGLIGLGLGLLSGIGRTKHEAFSNAIQGGMGGGMGLLQQALAARNQSMQQQIAARKLGLEERQVMTGEKKAAAEEALSRSHGAYYDEQAGQIRRDAQAMEEFVRRIRERQGQQPQSQPQQLVPREPGGGLISSANNIGLGQGPSGLGLSIRQNGLGAPMGSQESPKNVPMSGTLQVGQPEGAGFPLSDALSLLGSKNFTPIMEYWKNIQDKVIYEPNSGIPRYERTGGVVPGLSPLPMFRGDSGGASQMRQNPDGTYSVVPVAGSLENVTNQRRAEELAKAAFNFNKLQLPTGQETMVSNAELARRESGARPTNGSPQGVNFPALWEAIRSIENPSGNPNAVSPQGASGSAQIMPATFTQYARPGESFQNDTHRTNAAMRKLHDDLNFYGGDPVKAAAAYIGGRSAVKSNGELRDTGPDALGTTPKAYSARVMQKYNELTNTGESSQGLMFGMTNEQKIAQGIREKTGEAQGSGIGAGRAKRQEELFQMANNAQQTASNMKLIGDLLGNFEGGKLTPAGFELARAANSVGIKIDPNLPNKEAARSFANLGALELRNSMGTNLLPGQMSNADRDFMTAIAPRLEMSAEGRKILIAAHLAVADRANLIADMASQWLSKHNREALTEDFFRQVRTYNKENPMFADVTNMARNLQSRRNK